MRKTTTILAMLFVCLTVAAQSWTPVDERQYDDETIVYASLWNRGSRVKDNGNKLEVAAFIDGECRAVAEASSTGDGLLFVLRVVGSRNTDHGKKMEFCIYERSTALEFNLSAGSDVFFTGESEGMPSHPIALSYASPSSLAVADIHLLTGQTVDLYDYLVVAPENSTLPNGISWSVNGDVATVEGNLLKAVSPGETTYDLVIYNQVIASAKVTIESVIMPQAFIVTFEPIAAGETKVMTLTPVPEEASVEASGYQLEMTGTINGWQAADCELVSTSPLSYRVTPLYPGRVNVRLSGNAIPLYDGNGQAYSGFEAAAPLRLQEGWQWVTNAFNSIAGEDFPNVYGGDALIEIRTHEHLLYNDPEWGYFGTLVDVGLPRNTAYKVRMAKGPIMSRLWNVSFPHGLSVEVKSGWTWIPSPYYYNRTFEHAFTDVSTLPGGLTIISKTGGVAEWDGTSWGGDLQAVMAGEYFLCYSPAVEDFTLTYADETLMAQGDEATLSAPVGPWLFDASLYSDNMTLVATVSGLPNPGDYVIGAFVGNECRGEGHWVDDRFFITAHVERFDVVSLRLCHLSTGSQYAIDESFPVQTHLGSLSCPVRLHSTEFTTGIADSFSDTPAPSQCYDLMGRRVTDSHRGPTLVRPANGKAKVFIRQ